MVQGVAKGKIEGYLRGEGRRNEIFKACSSCLKGRE